MCSKSEIGALLRKSVSSFKGVDTVIVYFSLTGNTEKVANLLKEITGAGCYKIKSLNLPRFVWLILSSLPVWRIFNIPIVVDSALRLNNYKNILLGFPKWSFECPPISNFIKKSKLKGKAIIPFMTYGGWDYERYYNRICHILEKQGATIAARILIKRSML